MALKGGRRPALGIERAPGDVRPVTNRTLITAGLVIVVLVVAATTAVLIASSGTPTTKLSNSNVPQGATPATTSYSQTYLETANLPPVLRSAPARSDPATRKVVTATLSLNCSQTCVSGRYTGFGGNYALTGSGDHLTGSSHLACEDDALDLSEGGQLSANGQLPPTISGTLTRTSTCPGTEVASPVTLALASR
jgi:hypothetical protein